MPVLIEVKVPSPGESVTEVEIARWLVDDGSYVEEGQEIAEIDSDKATLSVTAEAAGRIKILAREGDKIKVGGNLCTIDTSAPVPPGGKTTERKQEPVNSAKVQGQIVSAAPVPVVNTPVAAPARETAAPVTDLSNASPLAGNMMKVNKLTPDQVKPSGRITKSDVLEAMKKDQVKQESHGDRRERREKMSMLRRKVSERLVAVKQQTAMLTTFNEVDMAEVVGMRKKYKEAFQEEFGVGLGFMSFFIRAVCEALQRFPAVNARIDGDEIIYHDYCDIGIAVSAPKGLMVPVIRNADTLSMAALEQQVLALATRAREGSISIDEMTGGTFTITNGGVFGSMLSTPILNPPQSAILGMHNIVERPVVVRGEITIRPVMYVALSYDHRIIDGRESVSFLMKVKEMIESPVKMLLHGGDPERKLLGL